MSCYGRRLFFYCFTLVDLFPEWLINYQVQGLSCLLLKSNIFYCLNPSTSGFAADPPSVQFKATLSWVRFTCPQLSQEQRPAGLVEVENPRATLCDSAVVWGHALLVFSSPRVSQVPLLKHADLKFTKVSFMFHFYAYC